MAKSVYARFGTPNLGGSAASGVRHTVKGGDTPWSVAARYFEDEGYSSEAWRQIMEENEVLDLDDIAVGNVWVIPTLKPKGS